MRSPLVAFFILASAALASLGCAPSSYPEPSAPPMSSSYGSASSFASAPSMPQVPHRDASSSDLVVRPDLVCVPFVLRAYHEDPKAAVKQLEATVRAVGERFSSATGGASALKMLGANSTLVSTDGKARDDDEKPKYAVTVDGSIDVKLSADADYWARTRLVAALSEASLSAKPRAREGEPQVDCSFEAPQLKVSDPEAYRSKLLERWTERTRAFARGVESNGAPLDLVDCAPPAGITQTPLSLEQVGLSLAVTCHLDVVRKAQ
jgi:hypothetical protein